VPLERSQLYMCTGRQQQERCRGYGPSRRSFGRESCKMTRMLQAVFEKCLRDCNSRICALSQNGYGDRRVKARKCTCCVPLDKNHRSRRALVVSDARCNTAIHGMAVSDQDGYRSDHALSLSSLAPQHLAKPP
jgi:hypothetical protein